MKNYLGGDSMDELLRFAKVAAEVARQGIVKTMLEDGVQGWRTTTLERVKEIVEGEWAQVESKCGRTTFSRVEYALVRQRLMERLVEEVMLDASDALTDAGWEPGHGEAAVEEILREVEEWGEPLDGIPAEQWGAMCRDATRALAQEEMREAGQQADDAVVEAEAEALLDLVEGTLTGDCTCPRCRHLRKTLPRA